MQFALFFVKKTSDSQQKPNSEFPTLESTQNTLYKSSRNTSTFFFFSVGHESEAVEKLFCWKMTFISSRVNDSQLHICTGKKIAPHPKKKYLLNKIVSKNKLNFYCIEHHLLLFIWYNSGCRFFFFRSPSPVLKIYGG